MKRRKSFLKIAVGFLASLGLSAWHTCRAIADHFSTYSWPSYPGERALRSHLQGKPHHFSKKKIAALSFEQCRVLHDRHHADMGGKPPHPSRLWMNRSYQKPKSPGITPPPPAPVEPPNPEPPRESPEPRTTPAYTKRDFREIPPRNDSLPGT